MEAVLQYAKSKEKKGQKPKLLAAFESIGEALRERVQAVMSIPALIYVLIFLVIAAFIVGVIYYQLQSLGVANNTVTQNLLNIVGSGTTSVFQILIVVIIVSALLLVVGMIRLGGREE